MDITKETDEKHAKKFYSDKVDIYEIQEYIDILNS